MDHKPIDVFNRLIQVGPQPGWDSIHVARESGDFFTCPNRRASAQATITEYTNYAQGVALEINEEWGIPFFQGEVTDDPEIEWAYWRGFEWMAVWLRSEVLAYIAVQHEDTELPVLVLFGVEQSNPC